MKVALLLYQVRLASKLFSVFILIAVGFLVAYNQNRQLIGEKGLLPAANYLQLIKDKIPDVSKHFSMAPTIFWLCDIRLVWALLISS